MAFPLTLPGLQFGSLMCQQDSQTSTLCQKVRLIALVRPKDSCLVKNKFAWCAGLFGPLLGIMFPVFLRNMSTVGKALD